VLKNVVRLCNLWGSKDSIIFGVDVLCGIWGFWDSIVFGIDGFCDLWGLRLCTIWD